MTNYSEKYQLIETEKKCGDDGISRQKLYNRYFNCILLYLACACFGITWELRMIFIILKDYKTRWKID